MDFLPICYGENGVLDFGKTCYWEVANLPRGSRQLVTDLSFMLPRGAAGMLHLGNLKYRPYIKQAQVF